jgi:hypothetical protein
MGLLEILGKAAAAPALLATTLREPLLAQRQKFAIQGQEALDKLQEASQRRQLEAQQARIAQSLKGDGTTGLVSRFGPETAKQLGAMINSEVPELRQAGSGLLAQLIGAQSVPGKTFDQRMLTPAQRESLAQDENQFVRSQQQQAKQWGASYELQRQETAARLQVQGLQAREIKNRLDLMDAEPKPIFPYGEPPKGYFPVINPVTQNPEYIPQPGTEQYNKAQAAVQEIENIILDIQKFQKLVDKSGPSGTEFFGPDAALLELQRGTILSRVAALRNLGVLQPAELENLDSQLPDPTSMLRNLFSTMTAFEITGTVPRKTRETILSPYTDLRKDFELRLTNARNTYWYVSHRPNMLPEDAKQGEVQR